MLSIKELELEESNEIYEMIQEIGEGQNGFINSLYATDRSEFTRKLKRNYEMSNGINLAEGLVPQKIYWFFVGDRPVGYGKLRHYLTDKLLEQGGHIGYIIRPADRNKKYGSLALEQLVKAAQSKGIREILLTCDEDNVGSRKVIESNNGVLSEMNNGSCKYWIR
jgi:predicted acetyltransferase